MDDEIAEARTHFLESLGDRKRGSDGSEPLNLGDPSGLGHRLAESIAAIAQAEGSLLSQLITDVASKELQSIRRLRRFIAVRNTRDAEIPPYMTYL